MLMELLQNTYRKTNAEEIEGKMSKPPVQVELQSVQM